MSAMNTSTDKDRGAMARTILQGLILAGVLAGVKMMWQQNVAMATLQAQVASVQQTIAAVPDLSLRVRQLETNQAELIRRQNAMEAWRDRIQDNSKLKGWTR